MPQGGACDTVGGTEYVSRKGMRVKRGEVPGEGRSGSEGRDAITPLPIVQCVSEIIHSFHYEPRSIAKKKMFSQIVLQKQLQFAFPLGLKKK